MFTWGLCWALDLGVLFLCCCYFLYQIQYIAHFLATFFANTNVNFRYQNKFCPLHFECFRQFFSQKLVWQGRVDCCNNVLLLEVLNTQTQLHLSQWLLRYMCWYMDESRDYMAATLPSLLTCRVFPSFLCRVPLSAVQYLLHLELR